MCILFVYMLLKVVSHYDSSVMSMPVMGNNKNWIGGGWVGEVSYFQLFGNFAKPTKMNVKHCNKHIAYNNFENLEMFLC